MLHIIHSMTKRFISGSNTVFRLWQTNFDRRSCMRLIIIWLCSLYCRYLHLLPLCDIQTRFNRSHRVWCRHQSCLSIRNVRRRYWCYRQVRHSRSGHVCLSVFQSPSTSFFLHISLHFFFNRREL